MEFNHGKHQVVTTQENAFKAFIHRQAFVGRRQQDSGNVSPVSLPTACARLELKHQLLKIVQCNYRLDDLNTVGKIVSKVC